MPRTPPKIPKTLIVRLPDGTTPEPPTLAQWKAAAYEAGWRRGVEDILRDLDAPGVHFRTCESCGRVSWQEQWEDDKCPRCGKRGS